MATVKVKFRASSVEHKEGTLYYQVIHERVARQTGSGHRLFPEEWDASCSEIVIPEGTSELREKYLKSLKTKVSHDVRKIRFHIRHLDRNAAAYTADRIISLFHRPFLQGVRAFSQTLVRQLRQAGKVRTASTYDTVARCFLRFLDDDGDMPLEELDCNLVSRYESYLRARGLCRNTTSFYMRNLRAIYNRAVEKGVTVQRNPFAHVYTGIDKTVKRGLPIAAIRRIKGVGLLQGSRMDYARDLFLFSFYTRGMSFVDMAFLKKKDLHHGVLSYRRHKTDQPISVRWEQPMQDIVDKYGINDTPYLLPIIRCAGEDPWRQYKTVAHFVNLYLRKLGEQLRLPIPLTAYVARHSWASIARSNNVPISVIGEAMGHDSERTTRIYLASLDTSVVDNANAVILNSL